MLPSEAVTGVERVSYHPAGTIRRPLSGDHYQEYNFLVYSRFFPDTGMEFELSRNNHYKSKGWPYTVSALFKTQGDRAKQMEAWRILRASVQGKELLPDLVDHTDENLRSLTEACLLQKMEEAVTDDADQKRQALPGSASSASKANASIVIEDAQRSASEITSQVDSSDDSSCVGGIASDSATAAEEQVAQHAEGGHYVQVFGSGESFTDRESGPVSDSRRVQRFAEGGSSFHLQKHYHV